MLCFKDINPLNIHILEVGILIQHNALLWPDVQVFCCFTAKRLRPAVSQQQARWQPKRG